MHVHNYSLCGSQLSAMEDSSVAIHSVHPYMYTFQCDDVIGKYLTLS